MKKGIFELYGLWRNATVNDPLLHGELSAIEGNESEIEDRFYQGLEFGTGGLRGVIGAGTNRMNVYTVARATAGFSEYIKQSFADSPSVVISYDSRNFSLEFARVTAEVFATRGIKVFIFDRLMPTPVCSYAIRALGASAGVMVTASHNPKIYNGYKAYGADGCQINLDAADRVLNEISAITDYFSVERKPFDALLKSGMICYVPEKIYGDFLSLSEKCSVSAVGAKKLKIVYTPLNGTGNIPVRELLKRRGFGNVTVVPEQEKPDGDFTTCPYPNPEERAALQYALRLAEKLRADLVLATDPDCDRVGIAAPDRKGNFVLYTGNETAMLLLKYLLPQMKAAGKFPQRPVVIKTIVTAELCDDIAASYGAEICNVLTGFKFIGEKIGLLEACGELDRFVLGFEESYGYLAGAYVRDKDAVNASMLIAEMTEYYRDLGKTMDEVLSDIYKEYGYYKSRLKNIAFKGSQGLRDMSAAMQKIRTAPPVALGGLKVTAMKDYNDAIDGLPPSNVLAFYFEGGKVLCRPSGTEPKLKIYTMGKASDPAALESRLEAIESDIAGYFV
ncbi:MAG: phospho-sugar mutase [Clostridiales bacterium]|jgi:phosphoglucomutase|nr:phospho-sugar mutase [Clostridiales bacterium]